VIPRSGVLAVAVLLAAAPAAGAVTISHEGSEIVVRRDPGEVPTSFNVIANSDRDSFAVHNRDKSSDHVASHSGPGCDAGAASCDIGNATALRVELGAGGQHVLVQASPIPVIVDGGAGDDEVTVRGGPTITVAGGKGDDAITLDPWAPPGGTDVGGTDKPIVDSPTTAAAADGGPGDDHITSVIPGTRLTGGAGNDTLDAVTERQTTERPAARHPSAQALDCGAGKDTALVDHRDALGAGCGPGFRNLHGDNRVHNTLGWFNRAGMLKVASFLRATGTATARITVTGPRLAGRSTYASTARRVHAGRTLGATLRPGAGVRGKLSRRTSSVTRSTLRVALSAHGDRTVVTLLGSLKRRR